MDAVALAKKEGGPDVPAMETLWLDGARKAEAIGDYEKAAGQYEQLLNRNPDKKEYLLHYADAMRRTGKLEKALENYQKILDKTPGDIDAMEGKGLALLTKGDLKESANLLTTVMDRDATRWRAVNAVGIIFSAKQRTDEALEYYKAALKVNDNNPIILNNIGLSLAFQGDYDKAIHAFQLAQKYQPDNKSAQQKRIDLNLALVYAIAGKMEDAKLLAQKHLEGAHLYNNLGYYARLANDKELAKSYLNMALTESAGYYDKAWHNLEVLEKKGN